MALHTGSSRNHHPDTLRRFGPDTGHGTNPRFQTVLFTLDETLFFANTHLSPGLPSVYLGAPWWFLDAPRAMHRFRDAVSETAGFYRNAGFIDDTRGFCSIPARHDTARRVDAAHLAGLVAEHVIGADDGAVVIRDLHDLQPPRPFRL